MKLLVLLGVVILSFPAFSESLHLKCIARYNTTIAFEKAFTIDEGTKKYFIGDTEGFQFFLSHLPSRTLELQSYDSGEPSRTYVTAQLSDAKSFVQLSVWKRDYILDVRCSQI